MSAFRVTIEVGDSSGQRFEPVDALVDTGSSYTWMPSSVLRRLGLRPSEEATFVLADGRESRYGLTETVVRLEGRQRTTVVVFGDENTDPLLGVVTLEQFALGVDALNERLIPTPLLLKGLR